MCSPHSCDPWCCWSMCWRTSDYLDLLHSRTHMKQHVPYRTRTHPRVSNNDIFRSGQIRTAYAWPCPLCNHYIWYFTSYCKPRCPLWNPDKWTQISYAIGTNCPHMHNICQQHTIISLQQWDSILGNVITNPKYLWIKMNKICIIIERNNLKN